MRIAVGQICQESNSFAPRPTTLETFEAVHLWRGEQLLSAFGNARIEIPGFLSVLQRAGVEPVPLVAAHALAGGVVTRAAFENLMSEMETRLAQGGKIDAVLLSLHGAMCLEDEPDAESEIIERVARALPPGTPIGVSLDLHGHMTPRMLQPNVFYIGYREFPHIDIFETAVRVAETMLGVLGEALSAHGTRQAANDRQPFEGPDGRRSATEYRGRCAVHGGGRGGVTRVVFPVQPWLDVPNLGFAVLVCADGDEAQAQRAADKLADLVWAKRHEFDPDLVSLEQAIDTGLREEGTTVVADSGDAPGGGSAADNVGVLKALIAAGADRSDRLSYLTMCDAEAANICASAGVGAALSLDVGHKISRNDGVPLRIQCRVRTISDGSFIMLDAGARGMQINQGLTVVVSIGGIRLVIRSVPALEWDTGIFTAFGLRMEEAALVFVKSPSHFRVAFAPHARRVLLGDTPGPTCANMRRLEFRNVTRPLFPLDNGDSVAGARSRSMP